jgi:heme/copper-type cytochrome/quinol oxidase subunit 1
MGFNSTNAKEIGTLYLIFAVFAGMIGTAFSVLDLSSPGVQYLQAFFLFIFDLVKIFADFLAGDTKNTGGYIL